MMKQRRKLTYLVTLIVAASMALAVAVLAASPVQAHDGKFEHADAFQGNVCPPGYSSTGLQLGNQIGCMLDGYSPVGSNVALCDEAEFGVLYFGTCTFDLPRPCATNVLYTFEIGNGDCLRPALVLDQFVAPAGGINRFLRPVCVEDDIVQTYAMSQSVGDRFNNGQGFDFLIMTGRSCTFNCIHGWDINCDGKIGDFCNADYDRNTVAGLSMCLADMNAEATPASSPT